MSKVKAKKINLNNFSNRKGSQFVSVDMYIFNKLKKDQQALAVYMQLKSMLNMKDGTCCPSLATIGEELKMFKGNVSKKINYLKELRLIDWVEVKEGRYPTRYYYFMFPQDMTGVCVDPHETTTEVTEEETTTEVTAEVKTIQQKTLKLDLSKAKTANKSTLKLEMPIKQKVKQEKDFEACVKELDKEIKRLEESIAKASLVQYLVNINANYIAYKSLKDAWFLDNIKRDLESVKNILETKEGNIELVSDVRKALEREVA